MRRVNPPGVFLTQTSQITINLAVESATDLIRDITDGLKLGSRDYVIEKAQTY